MVSGSAFVFVMPGLFRRRSLVGRFYAYILIFASMLRLVLADNLIALFIFWFDELRFIFAFDRLQA